MFQIIGYGEEALTYQVLTTRLDDVLFELDDCSDPSQCVLFYIPSHAEKGRSLIDDCDAVLLTPQCVYLIQAKWVGSKKFKEGEVSQFHGLKHQLISKLAETWDNHKSYEDFHRKEQEKFDKIFQGNERGRVEYIIDQRMFYILNRAKEIVNDGKIVTRSVYLVISEKGTRLLPITVPNDFSVVRIEYQPIDGSCFFLMDGKSV